MLFLLSNELFLWCVCCDLDITIKKCFNYHTPLFPKLTILNIMRKFVGKQYDREHQLLDFEEMLQTHLEENYPEVEITTGLLESRAAEAWEQFARTDVNISAAMDRALDVLYRGYEPSLGENLESCVQVNDVLSPMFMHGESYYGWNQPVSRMACVN